MIPSAFQLRMDLEKAIMKSEMPQFRFHQRGDSYFFKGIQRTSTLRHAYKLKLILTHRYPDQMPALYITSPKILRAHHGRETINSMGTTHSFHTLSNGSNECVQICHFKSEHWDASRTCVGVFIKGILWLEAYENHLQTGSSIADILSLWRRRQQNVG